MKIGGILKLLVVLCCVANCCAMNSALTSFAKEPVKFFQENSNRYNWIHNDTRQMLCKLPPLEQVREKIKEFASSRQSETEIDLSSIKNRVKEFYKKLLQDSGDIGAYLIDVAEKAIDKTEFKHAEKVVAGGSCISAISHGIDDVPPYLRIMGKGLRGDVYLDPNDEFSASTDKEEKARYFEKVAREKFPEYDDTYEAKYIGLKHVNEQWELEHVEFTKKLSKICVSQPDFKEVDSKGRWMEVITSDDSAELNSRILEAIDYEVNEATELLFMNGNRAENKKYKFNDLQDQIEYETWLAKIQSRFMNPKTFTDNYSVKVSYISTADAEFFLIHEIAHMIENAWMLKTKTMTENSNRELFSLYIETMVDYSKTLRLWEIYRTLVSNCLADLLKKKPNLTDMQKSMQSLEKLLLYEHELIEKNADHPEELQYEDFNDHIYGLYNAIKLHEQECSIIEVLRKISTAKPAKLTPQNFHEMVDYLIS